MIEMHQDGESLGDDEDDDYVVTAWNRFGFLAVVVTPAALAIASLVISLAALTVVHEADEIGDVALYSKPLRTVANLKVFRVSAAVQLAVAVVALLLALGAALRLREPVELEADADDDPDLPPNLPGDPPWVRALCGAGLIVSTLAVVLSAVTLIYALSASVPPSTNF